MDYENDPLSRLNGWEWPRHYRTSAAWLCVHASIAVALLALSGWLCFEGLDAAGNAAQSETAQYVFFGVAAALFVVAVLSMAAAIRHRVVLHLNAIEIRKLWLTRKLSLQQIVGLRHATFPAGTPYWVTNDKKASKLRLPMGLTTDLAFSDWMSRIADLDLQERDASVQRLAQNHRLGTNADERLNLMARWVQVCDWGLPIAAIVLIPVAVVIQPSKPLFAALALLPWAILALVMRSRGALRIGGERNDVRPNLEHLFALACLCLLPSVFLRLNLQDWWPLLVVSVVVGLGLLAATTYALPNFFFGEQPKKTWARRLWPFFCLYVGSVLIWANVLWATPSPHVHQTVATYKYAHLQKYHRFTLRLDPWQGLTDSQTLNVSRKILNSVSPGETVCVAEHVGWASWRWLEVQLCNANGTSVAEAPSTSMPDPLYRSLKLSAQRTERQGPLMIWLTEGRYAELDQKLNGLQRQYELGGVEPHVLLATYRDFYNPDPDLMPHFEKWASQYPNSYAATLARGVYVKLQAETLGAAGFEKWVSPDFNVEVYLDKQVQVLEVSTTLTRKPTLSYAHLMDVAMHRRKPKQMRMWLDKGLEADPNSLLLARKFLVMQRPMFGGSLEKMQAFVDECHRKGMSIDVLNTLDAIMLMQRAWVVEREGKLDEALNLFRQSTELEPFVDDLHMALLNEAGLLNKLGQYEPAIAVLERALKIYPEHARSHGMLGYALDWTQNKHRAFESYQRAAALGDSWAQRHLGTLYLRGEMVPKSEALAAQWLQKAAAQGDADAKRLLREQPALRAP